MSLIHKIKGVIQKTSDQWIPFDQYMNIVLYDPEWGYYMRPKPKIGRQGDFYTAPYCSTLFAEALSSLILSWILQFPLRGKWIVVEAGGGDGRLSKQMIFHLLKNRNLFGDWPLPDWYMLEKSSYHRKLQQQQLMSFPLSITWIDDLCELTQSVPVIFLSNELVDALPVHRVQRQGDQLVELGVGCMDNQLVEVAKPLSTDQLEVYFELFEWDLKEGDIAEVPLAARDWLQDVSMRLDPIIMITIDYGGIVSELSSGYPNGTLRCFQQHQVHTDYYRAPGESDITSHVHFSALIKWGEESGLCTRYYGDLPSFLHRVGIEKHLSMEGERDPFHPSVRQLRAYRQLVLPGGFGQLFRVLVQSRGVTSVEGLT